MEVPLSFSVVHHFCHFTELIQSADKILQRLSKTNAIQCNKWSPDSHSMPPHCAKISGFMEFCSSTFHGQGEKRKKLSVFVETRQHASQISCMASKETIQTYRTKTKAIFLNKAWTQKPDTLGPLAPRSLHNISRNSAHLHLVANGRDTHLYYFCVRKSKTACFSDGMATKDV